MPQNSIALGGDGARGLVHIGVIAEKIVKIGYEYTMDRQKELVGMRYAKVKML